MSDLPVPGPIDSESNASPTVYFGGWLGMIACAIGFIIFLLGCFGFGAAFGFAVVPLSLGAVGMTATIVGGMIRRGGVQHTGVLAGVFVNLFALVGGLLELAVFLNWAIFPRAAG